MKEYDHKRIEKKWQGIWEKKEIYHAKDFSKKPKYYSLIEFPYPSGAGLHIGHPRSYTGMDIISRKRRMEGYNVLYPIGWDAFGLPTENYAIKTGKDPRVVTKKNTDTFRKQLKSMGFSFDWSREINTSDPKYYKWTQWIFLQFFKNGLAYKTKMAINWCPKDKIGLANEEVVGGCCERCGTPVEKREKEQWMLGITKYAERLDKDLDTVDYSPQIKLAQRNWIGKSEGAEISFQLVADSFQKKNTNLKLKTKSQQLEAINVFTTRPDTIFGATYLVLAPEHELVRRLAEKIKNKSEVEKYIREVKKKTDIERTSEEKIKNGIELKGIKAINPANKEEIPVWIADYVLATYGTGAIMAVPAHDERDFEFAKKYKLPIIDVVEPLLVKTGERSDALKPELPIFHRNAIIAIVKHWSEDKYLCLKWKKNNWHGFVCGGIEKDEDPTETGLREIAEETGYTSAKFIRKLGTNVHTKFFHQIKKENRFAHFTPLYFELKDGNRNEIAKEELNLHEIHWISKKEVEKFISTDDDMSLTWKRFTEVQTIWTGEGVLINSGKFNNLDSEKAKKEIIKFIGGKAKTTFKLRDWIFSRQRYWGEPIPVVFCEKCGTVPVPEKDLPVELPKLTGKMKNYKPTDSGESPLANITKWVNTKCPKCKGPAKRETDTMPNWAGSSWYYLRYTDPKNKKAFADKKNLKYWTPVDWYNGGNEHTTLHLLYSRFWHKFLFDLGLVPTSEPYKKRTSHGMILGEGGVKMSKSLGNVINPDEIVKIYGADTLRVYEMFMGPFNQSVAWSTESIIGARRFIEKVWRIGEKVLKLKNSSGFLQPLAGTFPVQNFSILRILHKTIKKVSEDIEEMHFNTAISSMMILATEMEKSKQLTAESYKLFLQILTPFAPHITEELWEMLKEKKSAPYRAKGSGSGSINLSSWPKWSADLIQDFEQKIVVQINGKLRTEMMIQTDEKEESVKKRALINENVLKYIAGKDVKKVIYVKNRLINIVI